MRPTIAIVITARASHSRVQTVIEELLASKSCDLHVVLAGSATNPKFGNVENALPIQQNFNYVLYKCTSFESDSHDAAAIYTGLLIQELTILFNRIRPQRVVVIADRYETIAVSLAAKHAGATLYHLLAGERSGNIDDSIRDANSALADVLLTPTEPAYVRCLTEFPLKKIRLTGCPSVDLVHRYKDGNPEKINEYGTGAWIDSGRPYAVGMLHPEDGINDTARQFRDCVQALAEHYGPDFKFVHLWPNMDPGHAAIESELRSAKLYARERCLIVHHVPPEVFIPLVANAKCFIGNSSFGIREITALPTWSIMMGSRQRNRARAANVCNYENVKGFTLGLESLLDAAPPEPSKLYGDGKAGEKVANVLLD